MSGTLLSSPESYETLLCLEELMNPGNGFYTWHKSHAFMYMCVYT